MKDYGDAAATLFVGAAGFFGVIWTLRENARLTREQHDRAVAHERTMIRTALLTELCKARDEIDNRRSTISQTPLGEEASFFVPLRANSEVYDRLMDRLGILNTEQMRKVMDAYAAIKEAPYRFRLLVHTMSTILQEPDPEFIKIEAFMYPAVEASDRDDLAKINAAIEQLNRAV